MGHRILYIPKPISEIYYPEFGLLYNLYAMRDSRNICADGFHIPTISEWNTMVSYLGGSSIAGGKCKEDSLDYWSVIATANNSAKFNGRGIGYRLQDGSFVDFKVYNYMWAYDDPIGSSIAVSYYLYTSSSALQFINISTTAAKRAYALRPVKDSTSLSDGQTGTYTGNDGKVYRTICIGTQEWLADNIAETKFRNGDIIPWYGADIDDFFTGTEWAALTTAGVCAYDNTLSNVGPSFTFPT